MAKFTRAIAEALIKHRWALLSLAAILATFAYFQSRGLDFDRRIETMFAEDDPLLPPYQKLKNTFGGNEIVGLVYRDEDLLNEDGSGIERLAKISERLGEVDGVRDVLSLASVNRVLDKIRAMDPINTYTKLCVVDPGSTLGRNYRNLFVKYTHGTDQKTVSAVCVLEPTRDSDARAKTVKQLRAIANDLPQEVGNGLIVGEPAMIVDGFQYVEEDGWRLGWATSILLAVTIIICFRNLRWVLIPIVVVQFAVLMTKAVLVVSQFRLSMVSSMLTSIVTVTGIATVIHITVRFREYRQDGLSPRDALSNTFQLLAAPVFWTCLTTAAGFGSLLVAKVGPVQDFGLMLAIGSLFVLFSVVLIVPGLVLFGSWGMDPKNAWGEAILDRQLQRIVSLVEKSPTVVGGLILLIVLLTVSGMSKLDVESDFTKNFRSDTPIVTSYEYVEENLGGAGVWDIMLPTPRTSDNADLTKGFLTMVRKLETRLRDFPHNAVPSDEELPTDWKRYDRASSGFSAIFPNEPKSQAKLRAGYRTSGYASVVGEASVQYAITYREISPDKAAKADEEIKAIVERYQPLTKEKNKSTIDGQSAVELVLEDENRGRFARKWFLIRNRALFEVTVSCPSDKKDEAQFDLFRDSVRFVDPALTKVVSVADADEATMVGPILTLTGPRVRLSKMQEELPVFYASMLNSIQPELNPEYVAMSASFSCSASMGLSTPATLCSAIPIADGIHDGIKSNHAPYGYLRIMLRARERQSATKKLEVIQRVQDIVDDELSSVEWQELMISLTREGEAEPQVEVTGFFVLLTNLIKSMIRDQWVCFGVATATIAVMMFVAFRSVLLSLIALVPNALPIVMVFGLMGWLGVYYDHIKINMGAAMIAAVSMGLSVDSSIHYIISFQRERRAGKCVHDSLAEVQKSVGRAVVFSTLALIVGFSILCVSNFVPTIYFGVLVSLSMLGGLFGNLVVLPLLLRLTTWDEKAEVADIVVKKEDVIEDETESAA